jgi:hypothetical protein
MQLINVLMFLRPSIILKVSVVMLELLTTDDLVSFSDMLPVLMAFIVSSLIIVIVLNS